MLKIKSYIRDHAKAVAAWTFIFLFFLFTFWRGSFIFSLIHAIMVMFALIMLSLFESHVLVKYFLFKGRTILFYLLNVVVLVPYCWFSILSELDMANFMQNYLPISFDESITSTPKIFFPYLIRLLIYTATAGITAISCFQNNEKENLKIRNELNSEKLDMELRYLKSQINPHFLFNALNNIYSMTYIHDDKAPESVLKLSEMLRYVMVDCQADTISLEKEMKYLDNFIDFQLIRMEKSPNVKFDKTIEDLEYKMPPMIFQPLVENSFKHSRLESDTNGFIYFNIVQKGSSLTFVARNSIKISCLPETVGKKKESGIGLANVRKRLDLYYGSHYSFETKSEANMFESVIKIFENK